MWLRHLHSINCGTEKLGQIPDLDLQLDRDGNARGISRLWVAQSPAHELFAHHFGEIKFIPIKIIHHAAALGARGPAVCQQI